MKSIKEIFNKEMVRVFKDKKMVFSVFFLPVIIMIGIMYLMSQMITGMEDDITKHKPIAYVQNEQESFEKFLESIHADYKIHAISESERADVETKIRDGEADLLIEFPKNMDEMIQDYKEEIRLHRSRPITIRRKNILMRHIKRSLWKYLRRTVRRC